MSNPEAAAASTTTSAPDAAAWPAPCRRIITSHPESSTTGSQVVQHVSSVPLTPVLSSRAAITPPFSHPLPAPITTPATLSSADIATSISPTVVPGVVRPCGVNGQITELTPNFRVGMHRTSSVDYNVMVKGWAWHITPAEEEGGEERRERVDVGDVVVQRGTLHAWEAGPEGARWVCVVVAAEPVEVGGKTLEPVDF